MASALLSRFCPSCYTGFLQEDPSHSPTTCPVYSLHPATPGSGSRHLEGPCLGQESWEQSYHPKEAPLRPRMLSFPISNTMADGRRQPGPLCGQLHMWVCCGDNERFQSQRPAEETHLKNEPETRQREKVALARPLCVCLGWSHLHGSGHDYLQLIIQGPIAQRLLGKTCSGLSQLSADVARFIHRYMYPQIQKVSKRHPIPQT